LTSFFVTTGIERRSGLSLMSGRPNRGADCGTGNVMKLTLRICEIGIGGKETT
jgi:hypothetical protein